VHKFTERSESLSSNITTQK